MYRIDKTSYSLYSRNHNKLGFIFNKVIDWKFNSTLNLSFSKLYMVIVQVIAWKGEQWIENRSISNFYRDSSYGEFVSEPP